MAILSEVFLWFIFVSLMYAAISVWVVVTMSVWVVVTMSVRVVVTHERMGCSYHERIGHSYHERMGPSYHVHVRFKTLFVMQLLHFVCWIYFGEWCKFHYGKDINNMSVERKLNQ